MLESLAARRPCVTTEVGCCRELLEGAPGDTFGTAGYCVPPMYRQGLADAMERLCASRARREEMGEIGRKRVERYYRHEHRPCADDARIAVGGYSQGISSDGNTIKERNPWQVLDLN